MSKNITPQLLSFLLGNDVFQRADLLTITISNGTVFRVCYGTNIDITYGGYTYSASQFGTWERGPIICTADYRPNADSTMVTALFQPTQIFPGTTATMLEAVAAGVFNGATITFQVVYWPQGELPTGNIVGIMTLNVGQVGNVQKTGRSKVTFEAFDLTYILNRPVPPFNIQSQCRHTLYSAPCTIVQSLFTSTATPLDASSTSLWLNVDIPARQNSHGYLSGNLIFVGDVPYMCRQSGTTASSPPSFNPVRSTITTDSGATWVSMNGAYTLGFVTFVTGQNTGFTGSVKTTTLAAVGSPPTTLLQVQLSKPMPFLVAGGDTITLTAGCDKTTATCANAFDNLIHFGGMPYVPNPELAV